MADPKRQMAGRQAKINGDLFEGYIDAACRFYESKDIAIIEKTPEPFHVVRRLPGNQFVGNYKKKAQPDFKGLLADHTGIIFEAKHTDSDNIKMSAVNEVQAEAFERYGNFGAQCYVMVSIKMQHFYRVPWDVWKDMKHRFGHKHMTMPELEPYRLKFQNGIIKILDGIEIDDITGGTKDEK